MSRPPATVRAPVIAIYAVGIVGVMIAGLQPQLLGALAHEGRLSVSALGGLATLELLAMGLAAGGSSFVLPITRIREISGMALLAAVVFDVATPHMSGAGIFAARASAGLAEGVLVWVTIGCIIRSGSPGRWSGAYLLSQTVAQLLLATLLGLYVIPSAGSAGGFISLGLVSAMGLIALPWIPSHYEPLTPGADAIAGPPVRGLFALLGVLVYLAFTVAVWVYVEPLGEQRGLSASAGALIAPLSLAMQVSGAALATMLAGRVSALPVLMLTGLANLAVLFVMAMTPNPIIFLCAAAAFGFLWLFALPFQVPIVIAADPSHRAATLIGGAQLIGSGLGPVAAAALVADNDVGPVLWFGAGCILLSLAILSVVARKRPAAA